MRLGRQKWVQSWGSQKGMKHNYVKLCDYVFIFDADFQPEPNFLWCTIQFLAHNSEVALVQARWKFGNFCS
ncbi:Nucleotide-diphospho-sugar transferase [Sesbania bispinosa]|nr:Nucleotide-diphospho-sugar transferase [Sesbania bispinosa]